jgi:hypothetical protein
MVVIAVALLVACPALAHQLETLSVIVKSEGMLGRPNQLSDKRKLDPERRAAVIPIVGRYQSMVRLDNGARDGQSHAHAFGLAGEKRFEDLFQFIFGNARAAIRHG